MIYVIIVLVLLVLYFVMTYNGFVQLRNRIDEAFSTMDVYLVKRYDLIPNLVECVKGYAKHESETLEKVISARNSALGAKTVEDKMAAENQLTSTLTHLFALGEAYPDLKANTNFINLQDQLKDCEKDIANARKYYNGVVKQFNTKCETIPSSIIANLCHFERQSMFVVNDEAQRESVKVQF